MQMIELNKIYNEDCMETLKRMPDKFCDVFTDPKYNAGKKYGPMVNDKMPEPDYIKWIEQLFNELKRVSETMVIYTPHKWHRLYWQILGDEFSSITLVNNVKNNFYKGFVSKTAILLTNAKPTKTDQVENIWRDVQLPGLGYFAKEPKNIHPGYTTLDVTSKAISRLCKRDIIYDPQFGSGTTAIACNNLGKSFIGSELNPEWIAYYQTRLSTQIKLIA